jgi:hypothetical protein
MNPDPVEVHPDAVGLQFLLGTWIGLGHGDYPTIDPFDYREEVRFWHVGKPFLAYSQRTTTVDDGRPLHSEFGFWRLKPGGVVEVVVSHPSGHTEIEEGTVEGNETDGFVLDLASRSVVGTTTAKTVTGLTRRFAVRGDVLTYGLAMAAVGQPLQPHLSAELHRS